MLRAEFELLEGYNAECQVDILIVAAGDKGSLILINGIFFMINPVTFCLFLTSFNKNSGEKTSKTAVFCLVSGIHCTKILITTDLYQYSHFLLFKSDLIAAALNPGC